VEVAGDGRRKGTSGDRGSQPGRRATISQVLDGHVTLEVECLDRIDLNAYVPALQVGGQVVTFLVEHRGNPVPRRRCSTRSGAVPGLR
jgi:hypothetical protein